MKHYLVAGLAVWGAFPVCFLIWFYASWPPRPWGRAAVYATLVEMTVLGLVAGGVVAVLGSLVRARG